MTRIKNFIRKWVPLVSSLIDCERRHQKDAAKEILLVLVLSLVPIWGGALLGSTSPKATYFGEFYKLIQNGELILYATSILAPIFYLVFHDPVGERPYPDRYFQGLIIIVLLIISLLLFSAQRSTAGSSFIFAWSIVIFLISLVLLYLSTVFRNWMNDKPDVKQSERDFLHDYGERRGQE